MRKIELLCPASSLEVLKIAVIYGADAVYIGGEAFGLRAKAKNFSMEEMAEGVAFAHAHDVRVYVTANILAHNYDLDGVREYFTELHNMKPDRPDALIIADPAVFMIAKEVCPEIERHVSTQANNTNYGTYQFWWNLGASRVVTARELSLKEIKEIRGHIDDRMEIETFVHGAMCISHIPAAACFPTISQAVMQIKARAHIRAAGNTLLWRKSARVSICRYTRMSVAHISSTQRICA